MSRFDEFRESLKEADGHLEEAIDYLEEEDTDSEEWRYDETSNALSDTLNCLDLALEDASDNVGIQCDCDALEIIINEVERLKQRTRYDAHTHGDDEGPDEWHIKEYVRVIGVFQRDIDRIGREAR